MADEEGLIPTSAAVKLLLLENPAELEMMVRDRWFKPVGKDRWRTMDLIHGFIRGSRDAVKKANQSNAAVHLFLSVTRFKQLIDAGILPRAASYDLDELRRIYLDHQRKVAAARGTDGQSDLSKQRARLAQEKADAEEFRNKRMRGEYVELEAIAEALEARYALVKERVLSLPGQLASALVGLDRAGIEVAIRNACIECLEELYTPARLIDEARGDHEIQ
jgi:hypothetical protein